MDKMIIQGRVRLQGKVRIQGSKNGVLPVLAAVLLTKGETILRNVPRISDVHHMLEILSAVGCRVRFQQNEVRAETGEGAEDLVHAAPCEAVTGMRSSVYLLGAMLGRWKCASLDYPGGCVIGARPVDLHLDALRQMGAVFQENGHRIEGYAPQGLKGAEIKLAFPSVGATENVILAAVLARGRTVLQGAAREPEICILCEYLKGCGARIQGAGTDCVVIDGVKELRGCEYTIPGDRIVAGTYMLMTAAAGGHTYLEGFRPEETMAVTALLERTGCEIQTFSEGMYIQAPEILQPVGDIVTDVYPGFPTDLQSVAMVMALRIEGLTRIEERIFENRFRIVDELIRMGADVEVAAKECVTEQESIKPVRCLARVHGGRELMGCAVNARELRGGAALIGAGLLAGGLTSVTGCGYIDRGYENICKDLRELGARIYRRNGNEK